MSGPQDKPPTRLINVGSLRQPTSCRLFLPNHSSSGYEYLTLSHKWGGASILKLTKSNLESMLQGIKFNDLPLAFQHAIIVTQNLGYRYLWIDSLCIIQDDPHDWALESSTMSQVYSNSVLTIAALWGDDSHSGCFVERNPLLTEDCHIGRWKHGNVVVPSRDDKRDHSLDLVEPTPLLKRAWVFQERFLSRRILFYGPWELYWECGEYMANESQPNNATLSDADMRATRSESMKEGDVISNPIYKRDHRVWRHLEAWDIPKDDMPQDTRNYDIWLKLRAEYWSSKLTFHRDTLVAISGVIAAIEQGTGLHFLFGLCQEFLCSELLWEVDKADQTRRSVLSPTWSWASVEGADLEMAYDYTNCARTSKFHTSVGLMHNPTARPSGQKAHCLHLRGPLLNAVLARDSDGDLTISHPRLPGYACIPDLPMSDIVDVVCLVVVEWSHNLDEEGCEYRSPGFAGLLLVPSPCERSTFERVGAVRSYAGFMHERQLDITPEDVHSFWIV
ncbi:MAG: hypothetical protein Q9183_005348 [Haloplaca sp. 2 TL-2023]